MPMLTKESVDKLLRETGHAINANNGRCSMIEDVLCKVTTLCVELLNDFDEREHAAVTNGGGK